jgi:phenylalanyl-tRNA synthetase beta chain
MPTIGVDKYQLFEELGEKFTADTFQQLCFDFGIELDEDTEDDPARPNDEAPQYKIEIPANRVGLASCRSAIVVVDADHGLAV